MADEASYWLTVKARLTGAAQVAAQAAVASKAIKGTGDAAEIAGKKTAFAAEKNFLLGESMYSLRRYGFYAITSLGLTAGAVVKMGYSFNEAKDQGVAAFTSLLGSSAKARKEINALITVADQTGVSLENLAAGARTMDTFGYSVKQTNAYLKDFANYAQFKGLGSAGVSSLVSIFDRIHDTGKLDSRGITALQQLGVPGFQALTQGLHLSPTSAYQLQHGQAYVPGNVAAPALAAWLSKYAGSQPKSLSTEFGILKQNIASGAGDLEQPLNAWLARNVPKATGFLQRGSAGFQRGGTLGGLNALDPSGTAASAWIVLSNAVKATITVLRTAYTAARPFLAILAPLSVLLAEVAQHTTLVKFVIYALAGAYVYSRGAAIAFLLTERAIGFSLASLVDTGKGYIAFQKLYVLWTLRGEVASLAFSRALLAVTVQAAALAAPLLAAVGAYEVLTHFNKTSGSGFNRYSGPGTKPWSNLFSDLTSLHHKKGRPLSGVALPLLSIFGAADGATTLTAGSLLVGERGPEILNLPRGASVVPLDRATGFGGGDMVGAFMQALSRMKIESAGLNVDGKRLAEIVFQAKADAGGLA